MTHPQMTRFSLILICSKNDVTSFLFANELLLFTLHINTDTIYDDDVTDHCPDYVTPAKIHSHRTRH